MASTEQHRSTAEELLTKATGYAPSAPARLAFLAEAQVHATLALSASAAAKPAARTRKATAAKTEEAAK